MNSLAFKWMSRYWHWLLLLAFLLLTPLAIVLFEWFRPSTAIRVSKQITYITSPLTQDGLPDYVAARMERSIQRRDTLATNLPPVLELTNPIRSISEDLPNTLSAPNANHGENITTKNASLLLWRAMGTISATVDWKEYLGVDGMDPESAHPDFGSLHEELSVSVEEWLRTKKGREGVLAGDGEEEGIVWALFERPWKASELPQVADCIARYEQAYQLLSGIESCNYFATPRSISNGYLLIEEAVSIKYAVEALRLRSNMRIGEGDLEAAWSDLRVGLALTEIYWPQSAICLMFTNGAEQSIAKTIRFILAHPNVTSDLVVEIREVIGRLKSPWNRLRQSLLEERLLHLEELLQARAKPSHALELYKDSVVEFLFKGSIDWNVMLEKENQYFDGIDAAIAESTWVERFRRMSSLNLPNTALQDHPWNSGALNSFLTTRYRSEYLWSCIKRPFIYEKMLESACDREQGRQLVLTACDIVTFRLRNSRLPESLTEVTGEPVVHDSAFGQPIQYRKIDETKFGLYTLGANGLDDQGVGRNATIYGVPLEPASISEYIKLIDIGTTNPPPAQFTNWIRDYRHHTGRTPDDVGITIAWPETEIGVLE